MLYKYLITHFMKEPLEFLKNILKFNKTDMIYIYY